MWYSMQVNNAGVGGVMIEGDTLILQEIILGDALRVTGQVCLLCLTNFNLFGMLI